MAVAMGSVLGFDLSPLFKGDDGEMGHNSPQHHIENRGVNFPMVKT
jgi:hypothetical protein